MAYQRLLLHYGANQTDFKGVLSQRAVKNCWFELHRQGGCGAGQLKLNDDFLDRNEIEPGDWIACEYSTGDRWYFGRVEQVQSDSPSGLLIQLEGPGIELNEVFPGALGANSQGIKPHLYARTYLFSNDPDGLIESVDTVINSAELIQKLIQQYVVPNTKIQYVSSLIETGPLANDVTSVKFRGEESVRSIIKEVAIRARGASWGVNAQGEFFFLQQKTTQQAVYKEDLDLTRLRETRSRELLFNRVVLTGDYVYDLPDTSEQLARRSYRWRGNYRQPNSIDNYGERRIRMWVPWIRTREDSRSFVSEFFRIYAGPVSQYFIETTPQTSLPVPWLGIVKLLDRNGTILSELQPERVRVQFDHEPQFQMELGPIDPRELWPEPPQDERWELPENLSGFGGSDLPSSDPPVSSNNLSSNPGSSSGSGTSSNNSVSSMSPSSSGSSGSAATSATSASSATSSTPSSSAYSSSLLLSSSLSSSALNSSALNSSGVQSSSGGTSSVTPSSSLVSSGISSSGVASSSIATSSNPASSAMASSGVDSSLAGTSSAPAGSSSGTPSTNPGSSSAGSSGTGSSGGGSSGVGSSGTGTSLAGTSSIPADSSLPGTTSLSNATSSPGTSSAPMSSSSNASGSTMPP